MEEQKKNTYVKPETREDAVKVLEGLPQEIFSRFKGRILGLIEGWFAEDEKALKLAKDQFQLVLSSVTSSLSRKITDSIEIINKKK